MNCMSCTVPELYCTITVLYYTLPELSAEMLGLEGSTDSYEPLQGDEHSEVHGAALTDHPNLRILATTGPQLIAKQSSNF